MGWLTLSMFTYGRILCRVRATESSVKMFKINRLERGKSPWRRLSLAGAADSRVSGYEHHCFILHTMVQGGPHPNFNAGGSIDTRNTRFTPHQQSCQVASS